MRLRLSPETHVSRMFFTQIRVSEDTLTWPWSRAPLGVPFVGRGPHPRVQPFLRFPTKVPPEARPSPPAQIPIG